MCCRIVPVSQYGPLAGQEASLVPLMVACTLLGPEGSARWGSDPLSSRVSRTSCVCRLWSVGGGVPTVC